MVGITTHFTLISALCSLAAVSNLVGADAAAVPAALSSKHSRFPTKLILPPSRVGAKKHIGKGKEATKSGKNDGKKNGKKSKGKHHRERMVEMDLLNPLFKIGGIWGREHDSRSRPEEKEGWVQDAHIHVRRRSSVLIPDGHGGSYISHARRSPLDKDNSRIHEHNRRSEGVSGTVDIMSNQARLASLFLQSDNSTGTPTYVLNASDTNQTVLDLIPCPSALPVNSSSSSDQCVKLQMPPSGAFMDPCCATFNPDPPSPAPLTVEKCFSGTSGSPHKSQSFAYNSMTGTIKPMWFAGEDDGMSPSSDSNGGQDPTTPPSASVASITSMDDSDANGNLSSRDAANQNTQNVTLVFVASAPQAPHAESANSDPDSSPVVTTVIMTSMATETVTAVVTSTMAAAMDVTTSAATLSTSSSTSVDVSATATVADVEPTSTTASSSASFTSSSSIPSSGVLAVEVVGSSPSSISADVTTSDSSTVASSPTASLNVPSPTSINAEAIASSIAAAGCSTAWDSSEFATSSNSAINAADINSATTSATSASMTPVNTEPYDWMFREVVV